MAMVTTVGTRRCELFRKFSDFRQLHIVHYFPLKYMKQPTGFSLNIVSHSHIPMRIGHVIYLNAREVNTEILIEQHAIVSLEFDIIEGCYSFSKGLIIA